MGETCLRAKALRRRRGGGVRGRHENGQRATMLTPLNTHQSKLQSAFSFAHLEQGLKAEGFQLLNPGLRIGGWLGLTHLRAWKVKGIIQNTWF